MTLLRSIKGTYCWHRRLQKYVLLITKEIEMITYYNVSSFYILEAGLENKHVHHVNEITKIIDQKPYIDVIRCLIGKGATHRD